MSEPCLERRHLFNLFWNGHDVLYARQRRGWMDRSRQKVSVGLWQVGAG